MFWDNDPPELKDKKETCSEQVDNYEKLKKKLNAHQESICYCLSNYKDILPTSSIATITQGNMMDLYNSVVAKFNRECTNLLEDLDAGLKLLEDTIETVATLLAEATSMETQYQQLINNFKSED